MIKKLLLGLFAMLATSAFGQTTTSLYINVTDEAGNNLDMVGLSITNMKTGELLLDETVMYFPKVMELSAGSYFITATKFGYFQKTDTVEIDNSEVVHTIRLVSSIQTVSVGTTGEAKVQTLIPGTVTVIEKWQIDAIGARDVLDVLETVPGLNFSSDVMMNMGLSIRGNWSSEGKAIIQLNGVMLNEIDYGTMQWANRIPINNVERIEILRGPASILYGGMAALGVVNIITKSHDESDGFQATMTYGSTGENTMHQNFSLTHNWKREDNKRTLDISAFVGRGRLSDLPYNSFSGKKYSSMFNLSNLNNEQLMIVAGIGNLRIKLLGDNYRLHNIYAYGNDFTKPYPIRFPSLNADVEGDFKLNQYLKFTPRFMAFIQSPFRAGIPMDTADVSAYLGDPTDDVRVHRILNSLKFTLTPATWYKSEFIIEHYDDYILDEKLKFDSFANYFTYDNTSLITTQDVSLLNPKMQSMGKAWHLYGALRYNKQTYFSAFAPQMGTYMMFGKFNAKILFARSFKAPLAYNIIKNAANNAPSFISNLKPEYNDNFELELGYGNLQKRALGLNLYRINTSQMIVYGEGTYDVDNYYNGGNTGTQGVEFTAMAAGSAGKFQTGLSYYQVVRDDSGSFQVPGLKQNIAVPALKWATTASFNLENLIQIKRSKLSFSAIYYSSKTGYAPDDTLGAVAVTVKPQLFLNAFIQFSNIAEKGIHLSFGVYDILNQKNYYYQPYNGGLAPIPGYPREFVTKITINID